MKKALVVYASKTGTTRDAANLLSECLAPFCDTYDCRQRGALRLVDYEVVVLGTAMYMRKPMKELCDFCQSHRDELLKKSLMLFTCGIETLEEDKKYLWQNLPPAITQKTLQYFHIGGEIRKNRMGLLSHLIMRDYVKKKGVVPELDRKLIDEMCLTIKEILER